MPESSARRCSQYNPCCEPLSDRWVTIATQRLCPAHYQQQLLAEGAFLRAQMRRLVACQDPRARRIAAGALDRTAALFNAIPDKLTAFVDDVAT